MAAPEHVYRAVAEDHARRWGYTETLDPKTFDDYINKQAEDPHLRADADIVWRKAQKEKS